MIKDDPRGGASKVCLAVDKCKAGCNQSPVSRRPKTNQWSMRYSGGWQRKIMDDWLLTACGSVPDL